jgi:hypothetical protein
VLLPAGALFSLMIVVPAGYQRLKAALVALIFIEVVLAAILKDSPRLHPKIFFQYVAYLLMGTLYGIYGVIEGNPGALPVTKLVVFYVFVHMIFNSAITSRHSWKYLHNTLISASSFLCLYLVLSALNAYGLWPDWLYYALETDTGYREINPDVLGNYGRFSLSTSSLPALLFVQPYVVGFLITNPNKRSRTLSLLAVVMTTIMVLSGRRILLIIAVLSPLAAAIGMRLLYPRHHIAKPVVWRGTFAFAGAAVLALALVVRLAGISIDATFSHLTDSLKPEWVTADGVLPNPRIETIKQLFEGWQARPLFGFGSGASYANYTRSEEAPWSYEVVYMQFLYSWGICGCALYGAGIYSIVKALVGVFKSGSFYARYALPLILGMLAFLVATATNPYFPKFDTLFVIFLPVALINLSLSERRASSHRVSQRRIGAAATC